ncbi:hypothetical protein TNCV_1281141 [Trichonephila clavipes]|nr:hypothetical protein TNCV_1281141 [Trichonephila clavipes]
MASGSYMSPIYSRSQSEVQGDLHTLDTVDSSSEINNRNDCTSEIQKRITMANRCLNRRGKYMKSNLIKRKAKRKQVCLQWISLHVGVPGDETTDEQADRGWYLLDPSSPILSQSEIHDLHRVKINLSWQNTPAHQWYLTKSPGLSTVQDIQGVTDGLDVP